MKDSVYIIDGFLLEAAVSAEKNLTVLSALINEYDFNGNQPTQQEASKILFEARKILSFIGIAMDYTVKVSTNIEDARAKLSEVIEALGKGGTGNE